jgi:DNA-binding transcriptional regulator YhcF (GntR family)
MSFHRDKPIFQQIVERIENAILSGALQAEARVPAVRDYALDLEVNPNTVVKSFAQLEQDGLIFKKRGLGYFVADQAREKVLARRRQDFFDHEVPQLLASMQLLNIAAEELLNLLARKPER